MAANYWESTQYLHWSFNRDELARIRRSLEDEHRAVHQQFPLPEIRLLSLFFNQQLAKLGKRLSIRQQAMATAQVYLRRFYLQIEVRRTNPYLVIATALYLACKVEECPQHIRMVINESRQLWPSMLMTIDVAKIGECEFALISEMRSQMILYHPYRSLRGIQEAQNLSADEVSLAWSVINDHYLTDLPLMYTPYEIAVAAILLSVTGRRPTPLSPTARPLPGSVQGRIHATGTQFSAMRAGKASETAAEGDSRNRIIDWLGKTDSVNMEAIMECIQELISLYAIMEQWNENTCKEQIARLVRVRGLDWIID